MDFARIIEAHEPSKNDLMKARIMKHFKKRPAKRLVLKLKNKELAIEYMYGALYMLKRRDKRGVSLVDWMVDIDKLIKLINRERIGKLF